MDALRIYKNIIGVLGLFGNFLVCLVIAKRPVMQTRTNAFLFHQAVIDFTCSTVILLENVVISLPNNYVPSNIVGWFICSVGLANLHEFVLFMTSTYNLMSVTLERYFAIVHPFKYQAAFAKHPHVKVALAFSACWLISLIQCGTATNFFTARDGVCISLSPGSEIIGIFFVLLLFFIPVVVMLFAYIRTSAELMRGAARMGPGTGQGAGMAEGLLKARRNTLKTLLIVFIVFLVCWTPNQMYVFLFNVGLPLTWSEWYYFVTVALVATNSSVNPVIYALKYTQFRTGLREIFCKRCNRVGDSSELAVVTK